MQEVLKKVERRDSFVMISSFTAEEIYRHQKRKYLNKEAIDTLCFFDLHKYLCEGDLYCFRFKDEPASLETIRLTPIETKLRTALDERKLKYQMQPKLGKYRPDFVVSKNGKRVIVEADGVRYHVASSDAVRDEEIESEFRISFDQNDFQNRKFSTINGLAELISNKVSMNG